MKCLSKNPEGRYPSAEALAEDLNRFQRNEAILAKPDSIGAQFGRVLRHSTMGDTFDHWDVVLFGLAAACSTNLCFFAFDQIGVPMFFYKTVGAIATGAWGGVIVWIAIMLARKPTKERALQRQMFAIVLGNAIALMCIDWIIHGSPASDGWRPPPDKLLPCWAVVIGLSFFFIASTHSGKFYIYGVVLFILAVVMSYWPESSNLWFGSVTVGTFLPLGLYFYIRRRRKQKGLADSAPGA